MSLIHVVSVQPQLDLALQDDVLASAEATLRRFGTRRVWVDVDGRALGVAGLTGDRTNRTALRLEAVRTC